MFEIPADKFQRIEKVLKEGIKKLSNILFSWTEIPALSR